MAEEKGTFELPLNGKLITGEDPATIGNNFQTLKNFRYTNTYPKPVGGMTKINTTALTTYLKPRAGHHFKKTYPTAENHVLVQANNTAETAAQVLQNTTAIPSAGDFSGTALWTDSSGAGNAKFSDAPDGNVAYCNGVDACIWSGTEGRIAKFINFDPNETFKKDYSAIMQNALTDTNNIATLTRCASPADANTLALYHLDDNLNDAVGPGNHNLTAVGGAALSATKYKFGIKSLYLDGVGDWCTAADHADFYDSDGRWTKDFWVYVPSAGQINAIYTLYSQATTADPATDWMRIYLSAPNASSARSVHLSIVAASSEVVLVSTSGPGMIAADTWAHIEVGSADIGGGLYGYYIFINGYLYQAISDAQAPANYNSLVFIGAFHDGKDTTLPFKGYIDEIRLSNITRHTSYFTPQVTAYSGVQTNFYIAATRPLKGFKIYMGSTVNTTAAVMSVFHNVNSVWTAVTTLSDGTATTGGTKSLGQTGWVTFDSTVATSDIKIIDGLMLYWYWVAVSGCDDALTVYQTTVDMPFQLIKDLWDGELRNTIGFYIYDNGTYNDYTVNVFENSYNTANDATFLTVGALTATTDFIVAGYLEHITGLLVNIMGGTYNATANTILDVQYSSNGITWTSVTGLQDGTSVNGISFSKSGFITWDAVAPINEFTRTISSEVPLYYYKLVFSANLSGTIKLYYVAGIPSPLDMKNYHYSFLAKDRLWLLRENTARCSNIYTADVWNGADSKTYPFGDKTKLTGGCTLYSTLGSNIYSTLLFFKQDAMFGMTGIAPIDFTKYEINITDGLVAPNTLQTCMTLIGGQSRMVATWQGTKGYYMFDNRSPIPIHDDIKNFFDPRASDTINVAMIHKSYSFIDEENWELHWKFASGSSTTLNREFVFDLIRGKWSEIERPSAKKLQVGFKVVDTNGNSYTYGTIDTGYMLRLEYGQTFDTTAITSTFKTADIALHKGSVTKVTGVRQLKLIAEAKTSTTNNININHYVDTDSTASDTFTLSPLRSGKRLINAKKSLDGKAHGIFHSFKLDLTTSDETEGFKPMFLTGYYDFIREDY